MLERFVLMKNNISHVEIKYDEHRYVTREVDPDDCWDRNDTEATYTFHGLCLVDKNSYSDLTVPFDIKPDTTYYLVYADYDTGDSFGRDGNQLEFIDLFESFQMANEAIVDIKDNTLGFETSYTRNNGIKIEHIHAPWVGYFEYLNGIEAIPLKLI